jgi:hypothetical protein
MTELKIISYEQFLEVWETANKKMYPIHVYAVNRNGLTSLKNPTQSAFWNLMKQIPTIFGHQDYIITVEGLDYRLMRRGKTVFRLQILDLSKQTALKTIILYPQYPLKSFS